MAVQAIFLAMMYIAAIKLKKHKKCDLFVGIKIGKETEHLVCGVKTVKTPKIKSVFSTSQRECLIESS